MSKTVTVSAYRIDTNLGRKHVFALSRATQRHPGRADPEADYVKVQCDAMQDTKGPLSANIELRA